MALVAAHAYVGVVGPSDAWNDFATGVLGLSDAGAGRFRMDQRSWRLAVEPGGDGGNGDLAYSGWEVRDEAALDHVAGVLDSAGIVVKEDSQLALERGVRRLFATADPAGNPLELFYGPNCATDPFCSPTGTAFVTGVDQDGDLGFGHAVITVPNLGEALDFYVGLLGFGISDTVSVHGSTSWFLHVNGRHHSLAMVEAAGTPSRLHHLMFEVDDIDMVGAAFERAVARGTAIAAGLGRHTNDRMLSFYMVTPSGFQVEYGCGGRLVGPAWIETHWSAPSEWGHASHGGGSGSH